MVIRLPQEKKYILNEKKIITGNTLDKILVSFQLVGMGIIPWIWILSDWLELFQMNLQFLVRIIGMVISVFSIWYFWWIHKTLGENWSPYLEIRKEHKLIRTGPYKRIRHPIYTQIWLWTIAQLLITSNWIVGLIGIIIWAVLYFTRILKEEKLMMNEIGKEYEIYKNATGRLFPKF